MNRRHGFTLLELLLATALAGALMVLVLTVTASVRRAEPVLRDPSPDGKAMARLEELIQRDAAMGAKMQIKSNELVIEGYSRLEPKTLRPLHGATRVTYRLVGRNGHGYLLRQQTDLDNLTNRESQVELVMAGVSGFAVETGALGTPATQSAIQPTMEATKPRAGWLKLTVEMENAGTPGIAEKMLLID
jgi:prepilin-type N-terminal cleavage/methylation domain-containing protein